MTTAEARIIGVPRLSQACENMAYSYDTAKLQDGWVTERGKKIQKDADVGALPWYYGHMVIKKGM